MSPYRYLRRRGAVAAGEDHSPDEQKNRGIITGFICTEVLCLRWHGAVAAREGRSANEQKKRVRGDISSKNWIPFRSLVAQKHVLAVVVPHGAEARFSRCCAACACGSVLRRGFRHPRHVIIMFVRWHAFFESRPLNRGFRYLSPINT